MKTSVMLLFGGVSSEHEVSKMSAKNVYAAIDNSVYDVTLVYIDKVGKWWLAKDIDGHHISNPQLVPVIGQGQFITIPDNKIIRPDVLLPVIHGGDGEDGKIAHLGELLNVPVVGCDAQSSVVCWDKLLTKTVLASNDIRIAPFLVIKRPHEHTFSYLSDKLGLPFFVKPTKAGSSVGVSKVEKASDFEKAVNAAFEFSDTVLLETYLPGRELEVAILGNVPHHKASGVGEIVPGDAFYSYDEKYSTDSKTEVIVHADISDALREELREIALKAYEVCGCSGLARVDFLLDSNGKAYVNEINTFPGFTNISQYPKLWNEQGIKYADLIDKLIQLALNK